MKALLLVPALMMATARAQDLGPRVREVMELRQQVERLAAEAEALQKEEQGILDVSLQRLQELEGQRLREKYRADQIAGQRALVLKKLGERKLGVEASTGRQTPAWYGEYMDRLERELARSLPLENLPSASAPTKIRQDLDNGRISFENALVQTWFAVEAALKRRTSADFVITRFQVDGKTRQAEIARLGDLMAFARTAEGEYGLLARDKGDAWGFTPFTGGPEQKQVEQLLAQFKKNQKTGLYRLPGIQPFVETALARRNP